MGQRQRCYPPRKLSKIGAITVPLQTRLNTSLYTFLMGTKSVPIMRNPRNWHQKRAQMHLQVCFQAFKRSSKVRATTCVARFKSAKSMRSSARLAWLSSTVRGPAP
jgi:hypothetical protein